MYRPEDYLAHYGVLGMKWGRRKAGVTTWVKEAGRNVKKSLKNPILADRAFRKSIAAMPNRSDRLRRRFLYSTTKEIKDANKRTDKLVAEKSRAKEVKKKAKQLKKDQEKWDRNVQENWYKAYNKAVDYSNDVIIPKINKKYAKYDFSKDKKMLDKYEKEYKTMFNKILEKSYDDMFGKRPE